jgi:hypothetical protein
LSRRAPPDAFRADLGSVCDRLPAVRSDERQAISRLQIRLVETRERQTCSRRHEQRVEKLIVSIEGIVAGNEIEFDLVGTGLGHLGRYDDVAVSNDGRDDAPPGTNLSEPLGWLREIEDDGLRFIECKSARTDRPRTAVCRSAEW